ncbi:Uncharacterized protein FWK35_00009046 [Aphis craccivora]|uniref:Uncharacterized protein n=1 Tax=Aphis craccivora TaxID=307492 RepID=A0A6G0ZAL9_APHCR|nr:Uncharacterized protein FWK35_00009046 [Aphis craccivora]
MTQTRAVDFHSTHCRIWITGPSGQPATIIHAYYNYYIIRAHSIGCGGGVGSYYNVIIMYV